MHKWLTNMLNQTVQIARFLYEAMHAYAQRNNNINYRNNYSQFTFYIVRF